MTQASKVSWIKLGEAPSTPESKEVFQKTLERLGFVRNSQHTVAHKPKFLAAQEALSRSLMQDQDSSLTPKERELIALVVSVDNSCDACIFGHSSALRAATGDAVWVGEVEANYRRAALSGRERAIADYAIKMTRGAAEIEPSDMDVLRKVGLSETDIIHLVGIAAYFNFSNRVNSALGVKPNSEAYKANR